MERCCSMRDTFMCDKHGYPVSMVMRPIDKSSLENRWIKKECHCKQCHDELYEELVLAD